LFSGVSKTYRNFPVELRCRKDTNGEHLYEELKRLKKENARLKEDREVLKKATAYFAASSR
jgi:transposase-like protein